MRPLVDFYSKHNISPVRQDISNLSRHFRRRDNLYRYLGISPFAFKGKSIIEFGPGTGHNALFPIHCGVSKYVLVDGNKPSLDATKSLVGEYFKDTDTELQFELSMIEDFDTEERFDIVLCEGVITHQIDPDAFTKNVARFVKPGGILVITTAEELSCLPDVLRRVMRDFLIAEDTDPKDQQKILTPILDAHYNNLHGKSRPTEDIIWDNIINPWRNHLYSFEDAILTLRNDFDFHGSSPRFISDWRWYKDMTDIDSGINDLAIEGYHLNLCNFIDWRVNLEPRSDVDSTTLIDSSRNIYSTMARLESGKITPTIDDYGHDLRKIRDALPNEMEQTKECCLEFDNFMADPSIENARGGLKEFASWYGRSQQYVSFIRRVKY